MTDRLELDEHGVTQDGRRVVAACRSAGGITLVSAGFTKLDAAAARHVAKLLVEHATNAEIAERAESGLPEVVSPAGCM